MTTLTQSSSLIYDVSVFISEINDYVEIIGGKLQITSDGNHELLLECQTSKKEKILIAPSDLEQHFKTNAV
ncbi:MAG: hypothetical protein ACKPKW_16860, partial [Dolichospermum sp.]